MDKHQLLSVPHKEGNNGYRELIQIQRIFEESISKVQGHEFAFRLSVNGNDGHPFRPPQCEKTTKVYAHTSTYFIFFAKNLSAYGPSSLKPSEHEQQLILQLFTVPDKGVLFRVIKLLLEGNVINNDSVAVFLLYIRFRCHTSDGPLMAPGEILRHCAKLSYLMKLEAVAAEAPVSRLEAFQHLLPLVQVNLDNFSVFSSICRFQALAGKWQVLATGCQ